MSRSSAPAVTEWLLIGVGFLVAVLVVSGGLITALLRQENSVVITPLGPPDVEEVAPVPPGGDR
jgi:hypothetical protein